MNDAHDKSTEAKRNPDEGRAERPGAFVEITEQDRRLAAELPSAELGPFGNIPIAYALFRVEIDAVANEAIDTRYVFASAEYCRLARRTAERLVGLSHLDVGEVDPADWLGKCYRAASGEIVGGLAYSPLMRDWVRYVFAPTDVEGYCICALVPVDEKRRQALAATVDARTSWYVSEMLGALTGEKGYEAAMNGMLEMTATIINPDRLCIFECAGNETKVTFEWCAEGVAPQIGVIYPLPRPILEKWFRSVVKDPVALVPDVSILQMFSKPLYDWCVETNVESMMATPFYSDGEIVGFLGAYNYRLDETVDLNKLFAAVSSFIGARMDNRRLIESLDWAGKHDALTGLLNRLGSDEAIAEMRLENPEAPYVLAIVDIDDFKRANDLFGHTAGDEALKALARTMRGAFPDDTILCRNGGDEFLLVLAGDAATRADELIGDFTQGGLEFDHEGRHHRMTVSVGYAAFPDQADNSKELYKRADVALYAVKLAGKAGAMRYSPEAGRKNRARLGFAPREIAESIPYALVVHAVGEESVLLYANDEAVALFGCDDMDDLVALTGGTFWGMLDAESRERYHAELSNRDEVAIGSKNRTELRLGMKDGSTKNVIASGRFVEVEGVGKAYYTLLID